MLKDRCGVVGDGRCAWGCVAGKEVGHEDEVTLRGELVGLDLVVGGLDARTSSEEEEESGRGMRVVGGLGDVDLEMSAVSDRTVYMGSPVGRTSTPLSLMISPVEACPEAAPVSMG